MHRAGVAIKDSAELADWYLGSRNRTTLDLSSGSKPTAFQPARFEQSAASDAARMASTAAPSDGLCHCLGTVQEC